MSRPRIYVSGPMTGMPEYNFPAFYAAEKILLTEYPGCQVVNPAEKGIIPGWEWEDYLKHDIRELLDCDTIFMLPDWEVSRGSRLEHHVANALGYKVLHASWIG